MQQAVAAGHQQSRSIITKPTRRCNAGIIQARACASACTQSAPSPRPAPATPTAPALLVWRATHPAVVDSGCRSGCALVTSGYTPYSVAGSDSLIASGSRVTSKSGFRPLAPASAAATSRARPVRLLLRRATQSPVPLPARAMAGFAATNRRTYHILMCPRAPSSSPRGNRSSGCATVGSRAPGDAPPRSVLATATPTAPAPSRALRHGLRLQRPAPRLRAVNSGCGAPLSASSGPGCSAPARERPSSAAPEYPQPPTGFAPRRPTPASTPPRPAPSRSPALPAGSTMLRPLSSRALVV
jgi:hypothetical protein